MLFIRNKKLVRSKSSKSVRIGSRLIGLSLVDITTHTACDSCFELASVCQSVNCPVLVGAALISNPNLPAAPTSRQPSHRVILILAKDIAKRQKKVSNDPY